MATFEEVLSNPHQAWHRPNWYPKGHYIYYGFVDGKRTWVSTTTQKEFIGGFEDMTASDWVNNYYKEPAPKLRVWTNDYTNELRLGEEPPSKKEYGWYEVTKDLAEALRDELGEVK